MSSKDNLHLSFLRLHVTSLDPLASAAVVLEQSLAEVLLGRILTSKLTELELASSASAMGQWFLAWCDCIPHDKVDALRVMPSAAALSCQR